MDCSLQAPPPMGFSRQEYWSELPFPFPGDRPDPGTEPRSPVLAGRLPLSHLGSLFSPVTGELFSSQDGLGETVVESVIFGSNAIIFIVKTLIDEHEFIPWVFSSNMNVYNWNDILWWWWLFSH